MATTYPTSPQVTTREYEVWELLAHGASYGDMCRILHISQNTLKHYVTFLLRRVGVTSANELIVVWYGGDLLRRPQPEIEPSRERPRTLKETTTTFPTRGLCDRATSLTTEKRAARAAAHPWHSGRLPVRGDVLPSHD